MVDTVSVFDHESQALVARDTNVPCRPEQFVCDCRPCVSASETPQTVVSLRGSNFGLGGVSLSWHRLDQANSSRECSSQSATNVTILQGHTDSLLQFLAPVGSGGMLSGKDYTASFFCVHVSGQTSREVDFAYEGLRVGPGRIAARRGAALPTNCLSAPRALQIPTSRSAHRHGGLHRKYQQCGIYIGGTQLRDRGRRSRTDAVARGGRALGVRLRR